MKKDKPNQISDLRQYLGVVQPSPPPIAVIPACDTCRWRVRHKVNEYRCHGNPLQVRLPFENVAVWPVIPDIGPTGCRLHEPTKK